MTKSRRGSTPRSTRRAIGVKLLEVALMVAFLLLMTNVVLPWAAQSMADGFVRSIEQPR
jgi:hypothetical protein